MTRQIVLDTETTGLEVSAGNRILEIACVELLNRQFTGQQLHFYINPERDSEEGALQVHGLSTAFLADKPVFAHIADDLLAFVDQAEIIIHNAPFDLKFLDDEMQRLGRAPFASHVAGVIDSLLLAREIYPGKRNSLDALCARLEVDNTRRTLHGALLDAQLLAEVYLRLTRGQDTLLDETLDAAHVSEGRAQQHADLRSIELPLLRASEQELAAHEALLVALDKASGARTLWRKVGASSANS